MRNEKQTLAIEHFTGPCLVIAGPGSGKTKCLVERVCHLIENRHISPEKILVLTFTKEAACEMKERFVRQCSFCEKKPFFGTFHSFFFSVLKEELKYSNQNIITTKDAYSILKSACKECDVSTESLDLCGVLKEISTCSNRFMRPNAYESRLLQAKFEKIYFTYQKMKEKRRLIDFDDMQKKVYELFLGNPSILKKWQKRFSFVLLDEAQDMNELQFLITKLLVEDHQNLFAVGDDDQSIYEFRGARPGLMLSFHEEFLNLKTIVLDVNYRSQRQIVASASHFISYNRNRFKKEYKSFFDTCGLVSYLQFENEQKQGEYILRSIKKNKASSVGILFRNKRDGDFISRYLEWNKIPYYAKERFYFQDTNEILLDVIAFFSKYFGVTGLKYSSSFYYEPCSKMLSVNSYRALFNYFRKGLGYEEYLKMKYKNDTLSLEIALSYLDEIQSVCKMFTINDDVSALIQYLNEMEMKERYRTKIKEDANVFLYTYHGAKGLEFDRVFCIDVNEGMVPSPFHKGDMEEERRMFYVAITRAKFELYVCSIKIRGGKSFRPSVFINEMKD